MGAARGNRPLLLGHRGARGPASVAENTLAAFDRALADGCDGFEFDVRRAADGTPVICHDPRTRGREIAHTTSGELIHLPRLAEVLARYQSKAFLDIELKVSGLEATVATMLRRHRPDRGFVVSSFLPEVLETMRREDHSIPLGLICEKKAELRLWNDVPADYVVPHSRLATSQLIEQVRLGGKTILVWTVNRAKEMQRFAELGVDGIISDDTQLLRKTLKADAALELDQALSRLRPRGE